jgi:Na+-driven multidrug efflux pump
MRQRVYTRPSSATGEIASALFTIAWTVVTIPFMLIWAVVSGIACGVAEGSANDARRRKRGQ